MSLENTKKYSIIDFLFILINNDIKEISINEFIRKYKFGGYHSVKYWFKTLIDKNYCERIVINAKCCKTNRNSARHYHFKVNLPLKKK